MTVPGTKPITRCLKESNLTHSLPFFPIEASDGPVTNEGMKRCDDGSDESIASPSSAQAAVLKDIGRMKAIASVRIQAALKDSGAPATFTFFRHRRFPDSS